MTPQQYDRWKDFSLRMAKTCYRAARRPSAAWILNVVEDWFYRLDECEIPCIVDWDNSVPYPEGNLGHGRQGHLSYCVCDGWRYRHDGTPNPECPECHGSGLHHALYEPYCVGDMMSEFFDDYETAPPWCRVCNNETEDEDEECCCEKIEYLCHEQWQDQWGGPVRCCVRAGLDTASAPSAGVLGFTAGDIRRMYPEGVPEWIYPPGERLSYWPSGEPDGMFVDLPDTAGLCL